MIFDLCDDEKEIPLISSRRFPKLKNVRIKGLRAEKMMIIKLIDWDHMPKLERIEIDSQVDCKDLLNKLSSNQILKESLGYLSISGSNVNSTEIGELSSLSKLRILKIDKINDSENFFDQCSKLINLKSLFIGEYFNASSNSVKKMFSCLKNLEVFQVPQFDKTEILEGFFDFLESKKEAVTNLKALNIG